MSDTLVVSTPATDAPASEAPSVNPAVVAPNKKARRAAAKAAKQAAAPPALAKLPKMPRLRKAKAPRPCECGCGLSTRGGRFVPGHDARLHGWVLRVERNIVKLADIPDGEQQAVARALKARRAKSA